ncbi:hypothetical protein C9F11_10185 [Streptomyces sp. YIM 121038]|uniref:hypothetical protein n=1 Tax=Streptomyces sp. YIM 121038 TaxID=2136401 RepID=UPI0011103362|nr:hypothetical protein [Streptomyces sp. YIM 121038]QCX75717.1 hypothetical protein C9F11_10185 [Streptomyces sp. YIM 121038]
MAESSYPFDASNSSGGTAVVSQTQWQDMAVRWAPDGIDYRLTGPSPTDLPFSAAVVNGRQVQVRSGAAWVGGFYYRSTATVSLDIAETTTKARKDLIVIRLDMAQSAARLAVLKGVESATPTEPRPTQVRGAIWETPLWAVDVPAANGAVTVTRRGPFAMPAPVAYPWGAEDSALLVPRNTLAYDLDANNDGGQQEAWHGHDGYAVTRHLGKSETYTPSTINTSFQLPSADRVGRWRWIAPNVMWFQITIRNSLDQGAMVKGGEWRVGVTLPRKCNPRGIQVLHGYMSNPDLSGNLPNMISVTATTEPGTSTLLLHTPNNKTPSEGLDGLRGFPAKSTYSISGVLEANELKE